MTPRDDPRAARRAERKLSGWPALVGLLLGALLVLHLRAADDLLRTRDVQAVLLLLALAGFAGAGLLALLGRGLRRLCGPGTGRWPYAAAWLSWWTCVSALTASAVVGGWRAFTTGDFWA